MALSELVWTVLFFAGLVQGLFIAGVLLTSGARERGQAVLLALIALIFAAMIGEELVDITGLYPVWPHAALSTFALPLAIGPLLLLYAQRFGAPSLGCRARDLLHFLPLIATVLYLAPFYLSTGAEKLAALRGPYQEAIDGLVVMKGLQVLAYQGVAILVCTRAMRRLSSPGRRHCIWFRRTLVVTLGPVAFIHVLYFFPGLAPFAGAGSDQFGSLVLAALIYSFAYAAMRRPSFWGAASEQPGPKYRTSRLDETEKRAHRDALLFYMERHEPYRNPEVSLDDVAQALEVSPHTLSQIINELEGVNFYTFMNGYRVEAVKSMMADSALEHRKLLALAFDAGFNSKTSFNRVFRARTGMTPSAYRRRLAKVEVGSAEPLSS